MTYLNPSASYWADFPATAEQTPSSGCRAGHEGEHRAFFAPQPGVPGTHCSIFPARAGPFPEMDRFQAGEVSPGPGGREFQEGLSQPGRPTSLHSSPVSPLHSVDPLSAPPRPEQHRLTTCPECFLPDCHPPPCSRDNCCEAQVADSWAALAHILSGRGSALHPGKAASCPPPPPRAAREETAAHYRGPLRGKGASPCRSGLDGEGSEFTLLRSKTAHGLLSLGREWARP